MESDPSQSHSAADHWRARGQLTESTASADSSMTIEVVPYQPAVHGEMVLSWAHGRDLSIPLHNLPSGGRIVEDVAVGFMYRTDSPIAILEGLVANPLAPAELRDVAIDRIIGSLFDMVRADGFDLVWAWAAQSAVVERCRRLGFEEGPGSRTFGSRRV